MDGATTRHLKSLWQLMKYVLDTKKKCLMMDLTGKSGSNNEDLNDEWSMKAFCDSDYAQEIGRASCRERVYCVV